MRQTETCEEEAKETGRDRELRELRELKPTEEEQEREKKRAQRLKTESNQQSNIPKRSKTELLVIDKQNAK